MKKKKKIIKRYQNRKLYDTAASRYVTLKDIAMMIREGTDIQVIDNKSGEELTSVILTQIIFEEEKKERSLLSIPTLKNIILSGEESLYEFLERYFPQPGAHLQLLREEIDKQLQRFIKRGEITAEDGKRFFKDMFVMAPQRGLDELQKRLDESIERTLHSLNIPTKKDVYLLRKRLDTITKRIEGIEKKMTKI